MAPTHELRPGHAVEVPVIADFGAFVVSSEGDEPVLPELDGTGLERRFQTTSTTAHVGIAEQFMELTVRIEAVDGPPPMGDAERIVECVLDCPGGRLGIHDGPVDVDLRGTVAVTPGRWALRFAFPGATPEQVRLQLWPTTESAGTTTVHRPPETPPTTTDPDLLTGARAWDARYRMRSVTSPAGAGIGALTLHLDDDDQLWGFSYDDQAQPLLRRVDPETAREVLAPASVGPRWTPA